MKTLTVKSLTKSYHGKKALDNVSFTVNAGQIIGLLGPNGAGKTTTMSIITGILASEEGEVLFDGQKMTPENELSIKQKIGFLFESNPLYSDMLVSEYLNYVAELRGLNKSERKEAIKHVLKETGLEDKIHQPIEELSKGYKQRVGLAQAILHKPEILILDEPTEGLDPNQRVTIRDLIARLGKDRTVIISTHVLSEVQSVCDSLLILNEGKLVSEGKVEDVIKQGQQGQSVTYEVKGHDVENVLGQSDQYEVVNKVDQTNRQIFTIVSASETDIRPLLYNVAKQHDWTVYELHQVSTSLEDIFRNLTVGSNQELEIKNQKTDES